MNHRPLFEITTLYYRLYFYRGGDRHREGKVTCLRSQKRGEEDARPGSPTLNHPSITVRNNSKEKRLLLMEVRVYSAFETSIFLNSFSLSVQKGTPQAQLPPGLGMTRDPLRDWLLLRALPLLSRSQNNQSDENTCTYRDPPMCHTLFIPKEFDFPLTPSGGRAGGVKSASKGTRKR